MNHGSLKRSAMGTAAFAASTIFAIAPSPAQTTASGSDLSSGGTPSSIETVVVTAQKRAERAVDVPASLTTIDGKDLAKGGPITTQDLATLTPGFVMVNTGSTQVPTVRGITSLVTEPGLEPNVATYIDGVYYPSDFSTVDLADVESVDILKGPQGTLFGRNVTGGAILITTRKPSFDFSGYGTFGYGNFNDQSFKGFITGPLIDDRLAASIAVSEETNEGYIQDIVTGNKKLGGIDSTNVRAKLLYRPSDFAEFILTLYTRYYSDPSQYSFVPFNGDTVAQAIPGVIVARDPYQRADNHLPAANSRSYGANLHGIINTDVGDVTLIASYDYQTVGGLFSAYNAWVPTGGSYYNTNSGHDENVTGEVDFASKQFGPLNFISGLYYYHSTANDGFDPLGIINDVPPFVVSIFGTNSATAYAAFAEANYKITDQLTATAGVRYSTEYRKIVGESFFGADLVRNPTLPFTDFGKKNFSNWSPHFALRYALGDNSNLYFTYSEGFKSGGYAPSNVFGNEPPLTPLKPEKLRAYETGLKSELTDWLALDGSIFYYKYTNQQVGAFVVRDGISLQTENNAASSTIYGADIEATAQVTSELTLHSGLSLLHARFDDYPEAVAFLPNYQLVNGRLVPVGNTATSINAKGFALPRSPNWTLAFGGTYVHQFSEGALTLKADLYHSDHYYIDAGNVYSQSDYTNIDASAGWTLPDGNWTFTIWGRNLSDNAVIAGDFIAASTTGFTYAAPRTYGATISTAF